jgi:ABC-type uncharacterized transport system involved in gliding motility auxiliary subunit
MNVNWLRTRQTQYTAYITVYILVILAVLGAVNFLANRHNKSLDTTANKRYSLSEQTEKVVQGLKQDVKITLYDQTSRFSQARDLLDRYDNLSPKLAVDYVDPDKRPQAARAAGVTTYGTIHVDSGGKREEAKSLTEEEVTNALIRSLKGGKRTVCAVQGSGEHSLEETGRDGYSSFKEVLEKNNYATKTISLLEKPEVPADCTILLVGGPRFDYMEPAVNAIRDYVSRGGRAMILLDPPVRLGQSNVGNNKALVQMLEGWGVVLEENLVLDTSGIGSLFGLGPEVPLVSDYEYHAIVRDMREIATAFPLARSVDTKTGAAVTPEKLLSSSGNSYATTNLSSAEIRLDPSKDKKGPFNLAVAGAIKAGGQAAQPETAPQPEAAKPAASEKEKPAGGEGRFVVAGSSGWVANNILRFNGNRDLALNMMNWLSSDEDLISIRPKEPEDRRLNLSRQQMSTVFYSSVVFLPVLIIAAGIGVWWRRR